MLDKLAPALIYLLQGTNSDRCSQLNLPTYLC